MTVFWNGVIANPDKIPLGTHGSLICFVGYKDCAEAARCLGLEDLLLGLHPRQDYTHFESMPEADYLLLQLPNQDNLLARYRHMEIFLARERLVIVHDANDAVHQVIEDIKAAEGEPTPTRVLAWLFGHLTEKDHVNLGRFEEEVARLEDEMVGAHPKDCTETISDMRRRLMVLKRYYESMYESMEDLLENENGLLVKAEMRPLRNVANRVDRLYHMVLNLRDYVTQVREAYQNQLDIGLNQTMKLFTVVTTIFLPLTLLVGWYGMNLQMPEFEYRYAYPIIIMVSAIIVVGCMVFFKKRKWF